MIDVIAPYNAFLLIFESIKGLPSKIKIGLKNLSLSLLNSENNLPSMIESLKSFADFRSIPTLSDII